jgi:hypothetical protein
MVRSSLRSLFGAVTALAVVATVAPADARVDGASGYSKTQTYSGALRYLRVDLGYEVVEKDPDAAYLIFKYMAPGGGKNNAVTGTLEVIEASGGGVRLFVNLPRMPEYYERVFRDGLMKKLKDEYGAPPPIAKKPAEKPPAEKKPGDSGDTSEPAP